MPVTTKYCVKAGSCLIQTCSSGYWQLPARPLPENINPGNLAVMRQFAQHHHVCHSSFQVCGCKSLPPHDTVDNTPENKLNVLNRKRALLNTLV